MLGLLALVDVAPAAGPTGVGSALAWLGAPADAPLFVLLALCVAAAVGGILERRADREDRG